MRRLNKTDAVYVAQVPAIDVTRKGCHTAWMNVGTTEPSDDGAGLMIELAFELKAGEAIYLRRVRRSIFGKWLPITTGS